MKEVVEKYLDHLDQIFKVEPTFLKFSEDGDFPPLHLLTYEDLPELGMMLGFTCGVSLVPPADKDTLRKELMISVVSRDPSWAFAVADIGYQHRGAWRFEAGDVINHHGKISDESDMSSFLVWHQGVIREDFEVICLPEWQTIIMGLFPIYDDERELIAQHGPDWLFELVEDPCDVTRSSVAPQYRIIQ